MLCHKFKLQNKNLYHLGIKGLGIIKTHLKQRKFKLKIGLLAFLLNYILRYWVSRYNYSHTNNVLSWIQYLRKVCDVLYVSMNFEEFNQNPSILMGVVICVKDICHACCDWERIKNCSFLIEAGLILLTSEEFDFLTLMNWALGTK